LSQTDRFSHEWVAPVVTSSSTHPLPRIVEILRPKYTSGICSLVILLVVLASTGVLTDELANPDRATETSAARHTGVALHRSSGLSQQGRAASGYSNVDFLVLYLVDSQAQSDLVWAAEAEATRERESVGGPYSQYSFIVLKVNTADDEGRVREVLEAWTARGMGIYISDLRGR
jgi:hypothetical protein